MERERREIAEEVRGEKWKPEGKGSEGVGREEEREKRRRDGEERRKREGEERWERFLAWR